MVAGTRVSVRHILELSARGYDVDEPHNEYPTLPRKLIFKTFKLLEE
ncbi:DUF433 domain-containing protein [Candidatus Bathyarchaeota archaeon]|nr:DUF433 domain-containing protein [Candidatus Bathyarchaeota archaeon]